MKTTKAKNSTITVMIRTSVMHKVRAACRANGITQKEFVASALDPLWDHFRNGGTAESWLARGKTKAS
jgi:hypothetical protein